MPIAIMKLFLNPFLSSAFYYFSDVNSGRCSGNDIGSTGISG
jgi:hypothetical protein